MSEQSDGSDTSPAPRHGTADAEDVAPAEALDPVVPLDPVAAGAVEVVVDSGVVAGGAAGEECAT